MLSRFSPAAVAVLTCAVLSISAPVAQVETAGYVLGDTGIRGADPSVIYTEDGYVSVESRSGRTLLVRIAASLQELAEVRPVRVWSDRQGLGEVWAPEIIFRDGEYTIYFAAGVGSDHRMYRITSAEPADNYDEASEVILPEDRWAIDGLEFAYQGMNYFVWSGWEGDTDVRQDIFIAELRSDGTVDDVRVIIGSPDHAWENVARETPSINEGPQPIIDPAGQLHITYSANGSWGPNYCLADLRLQAGGDPLDPSAWFESQGCLFGANDATIAEDGTLSTKAKGVGHHSFIVGDEGAAPGGDAESLQPFLYHGVPAGENPANFWAARKWFIGTYQWLPNIEYRNGDTLDLGWSLRFSE